MKQTAAERRARAPKGEPLWPKVKRWYSLTLLVNGGLLATIAANPEIVQNVADFLALSVPPPWGTVASLGLLAVVNVLLRFKTKQPVGQRGVDNV